MGCCQRSCGWREGEREEHIRMHKENVSSKPLAGKMRSAYFCELLQPAGLKDQSFKDQQAWLGWSHEGTALLLDSGRQITPGGQMVWKQQSEGHLGAHRRETIFTSWSMFLRG